MPVFSIYYYLWNNVVMLEEINNTIGKHYLFLTFLKRATFLYYF